ncbi:MAG: cytochrome c oxidase subunit II [Chloroflexi bacterium]|nr:cytochrome c oxidase subunit II [Chloroflexota bacterium]
MLVAIVVTTFGMQIHVPTYAGVVRAQTVGETPPFDQPGVAQLGPGRYQVTLLAHTWAFQPNEIRVPAGSEVEFVATSRDVIHGLLIEGTNVNVMLVPGRITRMKARFPRPGEYLFICHEYCGIGHHVMFGKVLVEAAP